MVILLAASSGALARGRILYIEFFGYKGIDVAAVRRALPFREGDRFSNQIKGQANMAVKRVTGQVATDVATVCCPGDQDWAIFIGLPGTSSRPLVSDPVPHGTVTAPSELTTLYTAMTQADQAALAESATQEDGAPGYLLSKEPKARAAELALREYALHHEDEIVSLLQSTGDNIQRAMAAEALGYCARSARQIAALVRAARDPDDGVRNNSVRAFGEIVRADPSLASQVAPDNFIAMIHSGTWTDRNKASFVLLFLTQSRDSRLLARLQSEAGDALHEMAQWRAPGWSVPARVVLARMSGKSDLTAMIASRILSPWQIAFAATLVLLLLAVITWIAFRFVRNRRLRPA